MRERRQMVVMTAGLVLTGLACTSSARPVARQAPVAVSLADETTTTTTTDAALATTPTTGRTTTTTTTAMAATSTTTTMTKATPATVTPSPDGSWKAIPDAPGHATGAPVWTGGELVVWSGHDSSFGVTREGHAYRPASNQWHTISPSPVTDRKWHSGVWTGSEILYWGGADSIDTPLGDGAAYDPILDRWRTLSPSPLAPRFLHEAVWTGREMVVWGGSLQCCPIDSVMHDHKAAAYDPASDRWRPLSDVPAPWSGDGGRPVTAFAGGRVLVWRDGKLGAFDVAADRWDDLGAPPSPPQEQPTCMSSGGPAAAGAATEERLVVWTGGCQVEHGAAYHLATGRWSALGAAPKHGLYDVIAAPTIFASGGGEDALVRYHEANARWRPVDLPRYQFGRAPFLTWTGAELLAWGGYDDEGRRLRGGLLFRPDET